MPAITASTTVRGWNIKRYANGEISICAPDANPGAIFLGARENQLPGKLLYGLASAILEQQHGTVAGTAGEGTANAGSRHHAQ